VFWYGLLLALLVLAPWWSPELLAGAADLRADLQRRGLGLMLLAGFTGQFSIGHAAFLGMGAYAQAVLNAHGLAFPLALLAGAALSAGWACSSGCRPCA
jgi:branched-chain amino acid transport system permease protein